MTEAGERIMNPGVATGSVIIPAHNESSVIRRCLNSLLADLSNAEVEIIVVANGCTDDTAAVAREYAPRVVVLEIGTASKPAALRAGDRVATRLPRVYLDADVTLTGGTLLATLAALQQGALAARPPLVYDSAHATWLVRRYYRARSGVPALMDRAWGAGVYGLSAELRARFGEFPDVIGDDLWVDRLVGPEGVHLVGSDPVRVTTPRDARRLLRILRRAQLTKSEAGSDGGEVPVGIRRGLLALAATGPSGFLDAATFCGFALAARVSRGRRSGWERDDSSRAIGVAT